MTDRSGYAEENFHSGSKVPIGSRISSVRSSKYLNSKVTTKQSLHLSRRLIIVRRTVDQFMVSILIQHELDGCQHANLSTCGDSLSNAHHDNLDGQSVRSYLGFQSIHFADLLLPCALIRSIGRFLLSFVFLFFLERIRSALKSTPFAYLLGEISGVFLKDDPLICQANEFPIGHRISEHRHVLNECPPAYISSGNRKTHFARR